MKEKTDISDFIKVKHFGVSKEHFKKVKCQLTEWEKICVNHVSDEGGNSIQNT